MTPAELYHDHGSAKCGGGWRRYSAGASAPAICRTKASSRAARGDVSNGTDRISDRLKWYNRSLYLRPDPVRAI